MFENIRKKLYFNKIEILGAKGIMENKITHFNEEFYEAMNKVYFNCLPISMHIKYLKPTLPPGKCYDRSLFMFFCFDDALLVRADNKDLEIRFGKENAGHGWIEIGDYVYDPSLMARFDRDLYYKMYEPKNIQKITKDEYNKINDGYYDEVRNVRLEDFLPNGSKRTDLAVTIPLVQGIAKHSDNGFKEELDKYLELIGYDATQIQEELNNLIKHLTSK